MNKTLNTNRIVFLQLILTFCFAISQQVLVAQNIDEREEDRLDLIARNLTPKVQVINDPSSFKLEDRMQHYQVPGFSMVTIEKGEIRSSKGYGFARKEEGVMVDPNTIFQAGSISKSVTAILVVKLQEEGVLDIDENIDSYLKSWNFPSSKFLKGNKVTLRMLLSHTSGLKASRRMKLDEVGYHQDNPAPSLNDILDGKTPLQKVELDTIPGMVHKYSNQGFNLIQKILEDVTGEPFFKLAERRVLLPFDMLNSTFETIHPTEEDERHAYSYRYGKVKSGYWRNMAGKCSGGLYSTPVDLGKFMIKVMEIIKGRDDFLAASTVGQLLEGDEYGLGFDLINTEDTQLISHSGRTSGFFAFMAIDPESRDGFVMMTNSDDANDLFSEVLRAATKTLEWGFAKPKLIETISLTDEQKHELVGEYVYKDHEETETVKLIEKEGELFYFVAEEEDPTLFPVGAISDEMLIDLIDGNELKIIRDKKGVHKIIYDGEYHYYKRE